MESYQYILTEKRESVGIITMNRPEKLNAINLAMKMEIHDALAAMEVDEDVRVVIITGAGRAFSVGYDKDDSSKNMEDFINLKEEELLFTLDKPTIAAVHGYVLGDGVQQAMLCDMIVASENAVLGFIGPTIGALCYGSFSILPALVGRHRANELLFTCDRISAEEGYRIGLINKVAPHEELMPAAMEMACKIAQWPPAAIKYTKRAMRIALAGEAHRDATSEGWRALLGALADK